MERFEVYKFGGASIKDADEIENMYAIVQKVQVPLVLVFSAMGKMTNALEKVAESIWQKDYKTASNQWDAIKVFYQTIIDKLNIPFILPTDFLAPYRHTTFFDYNQLYDNVVSYGELFSSHIISAFFETRHYAHNLMDITQLFITDGQFRKANVDIEESAKRVQTYIENHPSAVYVTQGFIGGTEDGKRITLGRESSDYTAALLASFLCASKVTIWKDVAGVYDADPKKNTNSHLFSQMTYQQAENLALAGAQIIHPKTFQPLRQNAIPLHVRPFLAPENEGTIIH